MSLNKSKSLRTAEKYVLQGKIPAAIDEYRKVVEADPGDLTTINTLGDLYVRAGRIQDAIRNFSRIADSYREGGFTLKAIAMLKKISKLDPTNIETAMKLANLYSQQGLLVEARQQYLQVADAFARTNQAHKALEAYQKIADLDPSNTSVRMKLGEIYSREGMMDQAHDAFIMAGAELFRKNEIDHALTANLKAIAINPDSRQALTSLASIYTQQGQAERAINLLCEAFERCPGDVELLTILGRTYLSAGWMDDAERTFLSLVELDRTRYHYLLEVGRRFMQLENYDRAAEVIDGCMDILIAKREEDKAIDFLRRILDQDLNHIGALKRLAQIFMRIREDHNLIAALNSLVESAMKKDEKAEAIAALKDLVRLEPDEPLHVQRLKSLGVGDVQALRSGVSVPTTGPLDIKAAVLDEAFIIRQISEAEILAGHGKVDDAVELLKEILTHAPETIQLHLKLKDIYLRAGRLRDAAAECLELARIHETRGESARSSDYLAEARHLNPALDTQALNEAMEQPAPAAPAYGEEAAFGFDMDFGGAPDHAPDSGDIVPLPPMPTSPSANGFGFEMFGGGANGAAFIEEPDSFAAIENKTATNGHAPPASDPASFRYFDTLVDESEDAATAGAGKAQPEAANMASSMVFGATGNLPTDTMPRALRDELEGIEFYIAQGYVEIARDTLDRLRNEHGDYPEITALYKKLGVTTSALNEMRQKGAPAEARPAPGNPVMGNPVMGNEDVASSNGHRADAKEVNLNLDEAFGFEVEAPQTGSFHIPVERTPKESERSNVMPFLVEKESGLLDQDLLVKFNTNDLLNHSEFDSGHPLSGLLTPPPLTDAAASVPPVADEADQFGAIVSELESSAARVEASAPPPADNAVVFTDSPFDDASFGLLLEEEAAPAALSNTSSAGFAADFGADFSAASSTGSGFELPPPGEGELAFDSDSLVASERLEATPQPSATDLLRETLDAAPPAVSPASIPVATPVATPVVEAGKAQENVDLSQLLFDEGDDDSELQSMLNELREDSDGIAELQDYETHYNLGLAYKDMDLLDEAIEQFQMAARQAQKEDTVEHQIQCCHMLGFCFKQKSMPKVAVMWFQRGLKMANSNEDECQALRFEIGLCYEEMGEIDRALDTFMEVYGIDVNYRSVGDKVRQLQAAKNA